MLALALLVALARAEQAHPDVTFLMVNQGEGAHTIQRFLQRKGLAFEHVLLDYGNNALKEAGTDPTKLREAIEGVKDWPGVSGVFTMTPENHSGLTKDALVMVTVQDGKWKLVPGQGE